MRRSDKELLIKICKDLDKHVEYIHYGATTYVSISYIRTKPQTNWCLNMNKQEFITNYHQALANAVNKLHIHSNKA